MDQNYLDILEESLVKKNEVLDELKTLSEGQYECITDESKLLESLDPFIERKGELIEELEVLDTGFESLYEKVADVVENACIGGRIGTGGTAQGTLVHIHHLIYILKTFNPVIRKRIAQRAVEVFA